MDPRGFIQKATQGIVEQDLSRPVPSSDFLRNVANSIVSQPVSNIPVSETPPPRLNYVERQTMIPIPGHAQGSRYYGPETDGEYRNRIQPWTDAQKAKTQVHMDMIRHEFWKMARKMGIDLQK